MPPELAARMLHVWHRTDRHEQQLKRVTSSQIFFCQAPETGATAEIVSRPITCPQRGQQ